MEINELCYSAYSSASSDDSEGGTNKRCPICMRILQVEELKETECCRQIICKICEIKWKKISNRCPFCNSESEAIVSDDVHRVYIPIVNIETTTTTEQTFTNSLTTRRNPVSFTEICYGGISAVSFTFILLFFHYKLGIF